MNTNEKTAALADLARDLAAGLQKEREALGGIKSQIELQLKALRNQDREQVEETTLETSQEVNTLHLLRNERDQIVDKMAGLLDIRDVPVQLNTLVMGLAAEIEDQALKSQLAELVSDLPAEAAIVKENCKELAYSLQYALHLGQSFIEAIHGASSPPPVQIYTAKGSKTLSTRRRMMVNKIG